MIDKAQNVFGAGGYGYGFGGGFGGTSSTDSSTPSSNTAAAGGSYTPSIPSVPGTFVASPTYSGPTYNGQPVTAVYGPTTITTVTGPTAVISGQTNPDVAYYDNGVMCIDPGAVNNGPSSGLGQTDTGLAGNSSFGGIDTSNMA
jgi:hypothetical protein